jgi:hypothetical protein
MKNKKEIKKYDPEETKRVIMSCITFPDNKDSLIKELKEKIIPIITKDDHPDNKEFTKKFHEKGMLLMRMFENESHVAIMESLDENYRMLSKEMCAQMMKEFDCQNEVEKSLVELIVNAFIRVLDNSRRLNNELNCRDITPNRNIYIANLSKQIDRANRQYISALLTLKQLKTPQIEMNIKTNNAFISNNQQINVNKDENINA